MKIKETLLRCKEELNFLYRTPPFMTPAGLDYGWFCREHAFHLFFLLILSGVKARFASGHIYALFVPGKQIIDTLPSGGDHWWIISEIAKPIDLSVTPEHITPGNLEYVWGEAIPSTDVAYVQTEKEWRLSVQNFKKGIGIAYFEQQKIDITPVELLKNPFKILIVPSDGGIQASIHPEIFSAITLHLWKLAHGKIPPLNRRTANWVEAMRIIVSQNPLVTSRLRQMLEEKT